MMQSFTSNHFVDSEKNPAGGVVEAKGIAINWQDGPLRVGGVTKEPNGAFVETVIAIAKDRLDFYQRSKFKSEYNAEAIEHLEKAIAALNRRTSDREKRGVEGTHAV